MAPTSPARTIDGLTSCSSKKPPEIVFATSVERKAPTTLSTAARTTAVRAVSAPVAIGPAIELALSWKPLVKSKINATSDDGDHDEQQRHVAPRPQGLGRGAVTTSSTATAGDGGRQVNDR